MSNTITCEFCSFDFVAQTRCPHCAHPAIYLNVRKAEQESPDFAVRYDEAKDQAVAKRSQANFAAFQLAVTTNSKACIARPFEELSRLASADNEMYATFYQLLEAGVRTPKDNVWDRFRKAIDNQLFYNYEQEIRFAALTLNEMGLPHYGDGTFILRADMIAHRSTVFHENSWLFADRKQIRLTEEFPPGYRASWANRGKLAATKHVGELPLDTKKIDFSELLLREGNNGSDIFIEVHIFGSITVRTFEQVTIHRTRNRKGQSVKLKAMQEKLKKFNIPCKIGP